MSHILILKLSEITCEIPFFFEFLQIEDQGELVIFENRRL